MLTRRHQARHPQRWLIAYPTDSCFALGCQLGNSVGLHRIRGIRHLDDKHHFTLVCRDLAQLGRFVHVSNPAFRLIRASTPGGYTFILPATKEVPRGLLRPKKRTVGVRIPRHAVAQALLAELRVATRRIRTSNAAEGVTLPLR